MTHEKAVELAHHAMTNSKSRAHGLIDALIVLGVLDNVAVGTLMASGAKPVAIFELQKHEPAPAPQLAQLATLRTALVYTYGHGPYYIDQIQDALVRSGLKLAAV